MVIKKKIGVKKKPTLKKKKIVVKKPVIKKKPIKKVKPKGNKFFEVYLYEGYKKTTIGNFKTLEDAKTFVQDKYGNAGHFDDPDESEIWIKFPNGKEIFFEGGYYGDEWLTQKEYENH